MTVSLEGTMQGPNVYDQQEMITRAAQAQIAQQAQDAANQEQQAQQAYQQATQAPIPELDPLSVFLPTLVGNIASVIARDPKFRETQQANIKQKRADIMKARADNIESLQNIYRQRADAAQRAGNLEAETDFRLKLQKLDKAHDELMMSREHTFKAGENAKDRQAEIDKIKAENAPGGVGGYSPIQNRLLNTINDNRNANTELKTFTRIRDAFTTGMDAVNQKNSLGDIVIMRMIAKTTDPDTGVREEEFRTFERAQGTLAKLGVRLTREMWGKGTLNDYGREAMKIALRNIYKRKKAIAIRVNKMYENQATKAGIDPADVSYDLYPDNEAELLGEAPAAPGAAPAPAGPGVGAPGAPKKKGFFEGVRDTSGAR